jgi:hypothetical protein
VTTSEIVLAIVLGLAGNETTELSPWLAQRIVKQAALLRYGRQSQRAEQRAEEWASIIGERPGKLFKLLTASGLIMVSACGLMVRSPRRTLAIAIVVAMAFVLSISAYSAPDYRLYIGAFGPELP